MKTSIKIPIPSFLIALACIIGLVSKTQAVSPAPDGGYPGFNTAEGQNALFSLTTATGNVAVGWASLYSDAEGNFNTAIGTGALLFNTADQNTATGAGALLSNTGGIDNTANGFQALFSNTTGIENTANGAFALALNTTGIFNTAMGYFALYSNTTANSNTAVGFNALRFSTVEGNTAFGAEALSHNTTGGANTASGYQALLSNTTGNNNTAIGGGALFNNTTGSVNVAVGDFAGGNLTTGDVNIDILNPGVAAESNTIRIGVTQTRTFIAGIFGTNVSGSTVVVNSDGQLGVAASSRRFKKEIKAMDQASEALLALKPVTFRYKKEIDSKGDPQFGLVAEDVEKVSPDLVLRDKEGKPYTVRYDAVNAMLLNEFLKEHQTVQELKSAAVKQEAMIASQQKQIEALTAGLQKVSAQLEVSKSAPQVVSNP